MATIGTPVRRREDYRFLTGQGTYTDDINRPARSTPTSCAARTRNARIDGIDTSGRGGAPASSRSSPAPTWRPTGSAACPAAG